MNKVFNDLYCFYRKDGYLFDKEAILEYIVTKKREYARKLKEYEKQKRKEEVDAVESLKKLIY